MSQSKASRKGLHKEPTRQVILEDPIMECKVQNQCNKGKTKIPKNIRYELENSLLSLCDVWFEEIKPYLVRNNIKLHVHDGATDAVIGAAEGGGDHQRLPVGRTGCSHLDPGAASHPQLLLGVNCVGCCSTPRTASRVPCHKLRASPPSPTAHHFPPPKQPCKSTRPCKESAKKMKHVNRRRVRRKQVSPQNVTSHDMWKVPRPCRAYSVVAAKPPPTAIVSQLPLGYPTSARKKIPYSNHLCVTSKIRQFKSKKTQTEISLSCHYKRFEDEIPQLNLASSYKPLMKIDAQSKRKSKHEAKESNPIYPNNINNEKNIEKLTLLYKSPVMEESDSDMNLLRVAEMKIKKNKKIKELLPWR